MGSFESKIGKMSVASLSLLYIFEYSEGYSIHPVRVPRISCQFAQSARETIATAPSIGLDTSGVILISRISFLPKAQSLGDGRRQHIVFHPRDVCTAIPLPWVMDLMRDDPRFL